MMVVLVIIAIVAALIVPNVIGRPDEARVTVARTDVRTIAASLEMYRLDNRVYPTTAPGAGGAGHAGRRRRRRRRTGRRGAISRRCRWTRGGILTSTARRAKSGPYDLMSLGADGKPGGEGTSADIGGGDRRVRRDPQAGLTLIEMLVVLVIVAVMAGVAVLGLGALDRGARAEAEARRLADRLQLASDQVLVSGAPLAMVWDAGGYRFLRWDAGQGAWAASGAGADRPAPRAAGGAAAGAGRGGRHAAGADHAGPAAAGGAVPHLGRGRALDGRLRRVPRGRRAAGALAVGGGRGFGEAGLGEAGLGEAAWARRGSA